MKNFLVATDFSLPAENAAHYAIALAKKLKANVTLCNAFEVLADSPIAAKIAWPLIEATDLEMESDGSLDALVKKLEHTKDADSNGYCPQITFESEKGNVIKVISEIVKRKKIDLVIMVWQGLDNWFNGY